MATLDEMEAFDADKRHTEFASFADLVDCVLKHYDLDPVGVARLQALAAPANAAMGANWMWRDRQNRLIWIRGDHDLDRPPCLTYLDSEWSPGTGPGYRETLPASAREIYVNATNTRVEVYSSGDGLVRFCPAGGGFMMTMAADQFAEEFRREERKQPYVPAWVAIEDGEIYPCYSNGDKWNGWAMPMFEKSTALVVAKNSSDPDYRIVHDEGRDSFIALDSALNKEDAETFAGASIQVSFPDGTREVQAYGLGAGSWIWSSVQITIEASFQRSDIWPALQVSLFGKAVIIPPSLVDFEAGDLSDDGWEFLKEQFRQDARREIYLDHRPTIRNGAEAIAALAEAIREIESDSRANMPKG